MKILALDLGTHTGWAYHIGEDYDNVTGVEHFTTGRFQGGGMRFLRFRRFLEELVENTGGGVIDAVYFEEVRRHLATDAAHVYGGLLAMLTSWCEENKIPYEGVPVGTIKKFATGKGNAGKDDMVMAAQLRGYKATDDNEADAICLLHYALEEKLGIKD